MAQARPFLLRRFALFAAFLAAALPVALFLGDPAELEVLGVVVRDERPGLEGAREDLLEVVHLVRLEPPRGPPVPVGRLARGLQVLGEEVVDRAALVGQADVQVAVLVVRPGGRGVGHRPTKVDPAITARLCPGGSQPFKSVHGLGAFAVFPDPTASPPPGASPAAQRNSRYAYLVGRLRNRQMTMEEATELYGIMEGMLRTSEAARAALMRSPMALAPAEPPARPKAAPPPSGGGSDEFFLLGILAMGAGAGLLAAMTKRLQELPSATSTDAAGSSNSQAKTR